jgi:hypothetical protein
MQRTRIAAGVLVFALCAQAAGASSVSLLVIEASRPQGAAAAALADAWESGLFGAFFDLGIIASNAERVRLEGGAPEGGFPPEAEEGLAQAALGGMAYYLVAVVDPATRAVRLRMFRLPGGEIVADKTLEGGPARSAGEESEAIRRAAADMAALAR